MILYPINNFFAALILLLSITHTLAKSTEPATTTSSSSKATSTSSAGIIKDATARDAGAAETLFIFTAYSQLITSTQLTKSKIFSTSIANGKRPTDSANTVALLQSILKATHPNITSTQKKLVSKVTSKMISTDTTALEKQCFTKSNGGFNAAFDYNGVLYDGIKTYKGAMETLSAELPHLIYSVSSSQRQKYVKKLASYAKQFSRVRYSMLKNAATAAGKNGVKVLSKHGIDLNDDKFYVKFTSSSNYSDLKSAIKAVNKELGSGSKLNAALVRNAQTATEIYERLSDIQDGEATS